MTTQTRSTIIPSEEELIERASSYALEWDEIFAGEPLPDFKGAPNWPLEMLQDTEKRVVSLECYMVHYLFPNLHTHHIEDLKAVAWNRVRLARSDDNEERPGKEQEFLEAVEKVRNEWDLDKLPDLQRPILETRLLRHPLQEIKS